MAEVETQDGNSGYSLATASASKIELHSATLDRGGAIQERGVSQRLFNWGKYDRKPTPSPAHLEV